MKTRIAMMTAIAMMVIQCINAAEPAKKFDTEEKKIAYATKNLLSSMHSTNPGVVESAMRVTAQMKMRYPAADVSEMVNVMNTLWQKHPSGTMRYKAYIAMSICGNPEWYSNENTLATATDESFFKLASLRMRDQLLSENTN